MIHHGEFLRAQTRDDKLVYHISHDHKLAELEEAEQAMMAFAYKLNFEPGKVALGDVGASRRVRGAPGGSRRYRLQREGVFPKEPR